MKKKGETTYKTTKKGIIPRSKLVKLEAEGVKRGLKYIQATKNKKVYSNLILEIHKKSFGFIFDWAGKFRTIDVRVSGHEAPHFYNVPVLIKQYCDNLEERFKHLPPKNQTELFFRELISFLSWVQHQFVFIHPFQDYNGRTARLLTNLILLKLGLPMIEIKVESKKDRDSYIKAMQLADKGDYLHLENLIGKALQESFIKVLL